MLNTFPDLLTYGFFAPTILRLTVGAWFIYEGFQLFREESEERRLLQGFIATLQVAGGILLFVGFFTQVTALTLAVITASNIFMGREDMKEREKRIVRLLALSILVSLILTGAGNLAFDLPL
ncbi:MAG: hypothetical protein Q8P86_02830 [bacterium]|nr:hypothetical protein [bacterium]